MNEMSGKFEVGYGKPPKEHRFRKGQSGNPNGRPKGSGNKARPFVAADQPTDGLILEEAYRMVTIREGDRVIELPAIQAAMRSLAISAMKGSRLSQKALAEIVRDIEDRRATENLNLLEAMLEYKRKWTRELERRKRLGLELPDPLPHPDDIVFDKRVGTFRIEGPVDAEEKQFWDERFARRAEALENVNYFAEEYRQEEDEQMKALLLDEWHFEQRMFDLLNDSLPQRHKVKLENRSCACGASREGEAFQELQDNKALKGEYVN